VVKERSDRLGGKTFTSPLFVPEKKDRKTLGNRQEKRLSKELGLRQTPNSGAAPFPSMKGDAQNDHFVVEYKRDKTARFTITSPVVVKVHNEASAIGKRWAVGITIEGFPTCVEHDLFLIPKSEFQEYLDFLTNRGKD